MKQKHSAYSAVLLLSGALFFAFGTAGAQQNPLGLVLPATAKVRDTFTPFLPEEVHLQGGMLGTRIEVNEKQRLRNVDENDLLDAFERRGVPHQDWQGEHVGKFLHAATQAWAYTHDPTLKTKIDRVVTRLLKTQEADGYLGTYPAERRWTSWDVWVHKYDLLGLLTYYQFTHNKPALEACKRIGDLLVRTFGTQPGQRDINRAGEHRGMAADSVLEPIVLLYRTTGEKRYLQFAHYIVSNYDAPTGPMVLASLEKTHSVTRVANGKAYEMVSNFNGLLELYRATGEKRYLNDMEIAWNDIVRNRLYITGSASSFEVFQEDFHLPNGMGANICETCVSVTWEQMNLQLLRLTGNPRYAEQAERTIYNHLLAAQKPTGEQWAYYTPLEGQKPYSPETTCCLSSGPRGIALIPSVAYMTSADGGLVVNLYNSGRAQTRLKSAGNVQITQTTRFPLDETVKLTVTPQRNGAMFPLRLRIPAWAARAMLRVNGVPLPARPGTYAVLKRAWKSGDTILLTLPLTPRLVEGSHENAGKVAILTGPLVLAADTALNPNVRSLRSLTLATTTAGKATLTLAPQKAIAGEPVFQTEGRIGAKTVPLYLTPYNTAGQDQRSKFEVWIGKPGHTFAASTESLFFGQEAVYSRTGNVDGDINDGDTATLRVTFDNRKQDEDWFAVQSDKPVTINRVVFAHGKTFHDGGWFDTSGTAGKPRIQVQREAGGAWKTVAILDAYPETTAENSGGLQNGQSFAVTFAPVNVFAVRILGRPACGDNTKQAFASCAELQAFYRK